MTFSECLFFFIICLGVIINLFLVDFGYFDSVVQGIAHRFSSCAYHILRSEITESGSLGHPNSLSLPYLRGGGRSVLDAHRLSCLLYGVRTV